MKSICLSEGRVQCVYTNGSIQHTASTKLDIALLPEIQARSIPQFPDCRDKQQKTILIECRISNDTENYNVSWNNDLNNLERGMHISLPLLLSQCIYSYLL